MSNKTNSKNTVAVEDKRNFVKKNEKNQWIGVEYCRVKKSYNKTTKEYDIKGSVGCVIYGTNSNSKLRVRVGSNHLYAEKVVKDGSINLTWTEDIKGYDEPSTTLKHNNKEMTSQNARTYLLNGLNFKSMKFDTLMNIYETALKDMYEAAHPTTEVKAEN